MGLREDKKTRGSKSLFDPIFSPHLGDMIIWCILCQLKS